jgi:hypothetical protein
VFWECECMHWHSSRNRRQRSILHVHLALHQRSSPASLVGHWPILTRSLRNPQAPIRRDAAGREFAALLFSHAWEPLLPSRQSRRERLRPGQAGEAWCCSIAGLAHPPFYCRVGIRGLVRWARLGRRAVAVSPDWRIRFSLSRPVGLLRLPRMGQDMRLGWASAQ